MEHTLYHSILRVSAAVCALILLFDGGFIVEDTAELSQNAQYYVANAISVSVGIPPTELNTMTAALTERQRELDAREQAIIEREITLQENPAVAPQSDISTFLISVVLFILLSLIILNYGLDYARVRKELTYAANA